MSDSGADKVYKERLYHLRLQAVSTSPPGAPQTTLGLGRLLSRGPSSSCSPFPMCSGFVSPGRPPEGEATLNPTVAHGPSAIGMP